MELISNDELAFTRTVISTGTRIDGRGRNEYRTIEMIPSEISQSDGSIRLKRGFTEIEVAIQFKETMETLLSLGISPCTKASGLSESRVESFGIEIPSIISTQIENFFSSYKLGIRIELRVIRNDGNIYDLFFIGLNSILRNICVPVIEDLKQCEKSTIEIALPTTVALFENCVFVKDPTIIEEKASLGLLHVIIDSNGKLMGCISEGDCYLMHNELTEILKTLVIEHNQFI
ncbi:hypothetical protein CWI42_121920 [Ordospora colligata]|uniref:Ribosomal RNA-processing protein 42 n=1 Tax=Ordospora colligata OC4 TaxID=1354746 RepID=A0A0B2UIA0_9MICR|nr:uncharacterized protein M896_121920 [Ordospora colligata OC4]KHN68969.1 hypothetical protein M896_121920 [Ordospora colligata OC4]TBU14192.1 hypothetical protein CWI41_121920 [Ordospora colligata]TBU17861.1 hypothetical protein CWI42_121920 [Ordospora colligata]